MNNQFTKTNLKVAGRFNLLTLSKDQYSNDYLSDDSPYICLIPFERTSDDRISSVYLLEFPSPINGDICTSLLKDSVNSDFDKTSYDSISRSLIEEAGINIDDLGLTENDIFYLGDISMDSPFIYKMKCYAIDLSSVNTLEFTRNLSKDLFTKDNSNIIKVGFHQIVNGDYSDALILASSFLLISYFN